MEFEGQQHGERVLQVFRRHWLVLVAQIWWMPVAILAGVVATISLKLSQQVWLLIIAITLVFLVMAGLRLIKWYFSIYILTNQRLRFIDQKGVFSRATIDLFMADIHSASLSVAGVLAEIFKFGDVVVEAQAGELTIQRLANASNFYNIIQNAKNQTKEGS